MTKNWIKYYLLLGSVIAILVSFLCSFAFVRTNLSQAQDKEVFESIYKNTTIDFIVPSPSYSQISEIEQNPDTGIKALTPYYETSSSAKINGAECKGSVLLLADENKVDYTPYGESRIIRGNRATKSGDAIIDRIYAEINGCKIGDSVEMSLSGHTYNFVITGMTEANTYYESGTIALVLSSDQVAELESDGVTYSAAYVYASDYEKCKSYLYSEYKPYGRLKNAEDFDSAETYEQHVQNFNDANWSKEITNVKDNYSSLNVKYENVETGIYRNMIIAVVVVLLTVIIFNGVMLKSENLHSFFRTFLVKKSGTKAEIKSFYKNGIFFNVIIFAVVTAALYYWIVELIGTKLIGVNVLSSCAMIVAYIVGSLIMVGISGGYVEKNYTIKKKTENSDAAEEERTDIE